jgi:hypothetical protein
VSSSQSRIDFAPRKRAGTATPGNQRLFAFVLEHLWIGP